MNIQNLLVITLFLLAKSQDYDYQSAFSHIYDNKIWNSDGPLSGPGSNPCTGLQYLLYLQHLISRPDIHKIVQIGYGDRQMMQHIILQHKIYIGYDVVPSLYRQPRYNMDFRIIKNLKQIDQSGDFLIVRDVMQHWPTSQINYFISNILPQFKYALLTNDYLPTNYIGDIAPGQYRPINLEYLIKGIQKVLEIDFKTGHPPKVSFLFSNPNNSKTVSSP